MLESYGLKRHGAVVGIELTQGNVFGRPATIYHKGHDELSDLIVKLYNYILSEVL